MPEENSLDNAIKSADEYIGLSPEEKRKAFLDKLKSERVANKKHRQQVAKDLIAANKLSLDNKNKKQKAAQDEIDDARKAEKIEFNIKKAERTKRKEGRIKKRKTKK